MNLHHPPGGLSPACDITPKIIHFPAHQSRAPSSGNGLLDRETWDRMYLAAYVVEQFRAEEPAAAEQQMTAILAGFDAGARSVARMLEDSREAIIALRGLLANLEEADRRMVAAADAAADRFLLLQKEGA